jgi:hypothetical protein
MTDARSFREQTIDEALARALHGRRGISPVMARAAVIAALAEAGEAHPNPTRAEPN